MTQLIQARAVFHSRIKTQAAGHDGPEGIARMGIVFSRFQRSCSRHGTEDQHPGIRRYHWGKTVKILRVLHLTVVSLLTTGC
jgi:hypothetical protein